MIFNSGFLTASFAVFTCITETGMVVKKEVDKGKKTHIHTEESIEKKKYGNTHFASTDIIVVSFSVSLCLSLPSTLFRRF